MNTTTIEQQPDLLAGASGEKPSKRKKKEAGKAVAIAKPAAPPQAPPPGGGDGNFLSIIMRAATNPKCNVEKMQALLSMQREIEERDSKKAFTRDFIAMQRDLPVINRDGKIEVRAKDARTGERTGALQQSTPYATYPALMDVCKPIMDRYGFTLASWIEPEPGGARIVVVSQLDHIEHHSRTSRFPLPAETSGSKNNVQGWGSSQQYGMRYNAIALLNIVSKAVKDADTDGHPGSFVKGKDGALVETKDVETLSEEQTDELNRKMVSCKVPLAKVLEHYKIASLADLPVSLLATAIKQCDDYAANQQRVQEQQRQKDFPGDRARGR